MGLKFLGIQLFFIALLAQLSSYRIPDLSQANWDTVLFLTPSGIIINHMDPRRAILKTFYSDISSGQNQIPTLNIIGMGLVYFCMVASVVYFVRQGKNKA